MQRIDDGTVELTDDEQFLSDWRDDLLLEGMSQAEAVARMETYGDSSAFGEFVNPKLAPLQDPEFRAYLLT